MKDSDDDSILLTLAFSLRPATEVFKASNSVLAEESTASKFANFDSAEVTDACNASNFDSMEVTKACNAGNSWSTSSRP